LSFTEVASKLEMLITDKQSSPSIGDVEKKFNNIDRRPDLDCGAASLDPLPFEDHEIDLDVFRLDVNSLQFKSTTLTTGKMVSVL
jgi:hypothetical protein